jgi:putative transcriptional regulator
MTRKSAGSRIGAELVEAFQELAERLRGEAKPQGYEIKSRMLTPPRIRRSRRKVPASKDFEFD